jgi:hypothetical protein
MKNPLQEIINTSNTTKLCTTLASKEATSNMLPPLIEQRCRLFNKIPINPLTNKKPINLLDAKLYREQPKGASSTVMHIF